MGNSYAAERGLWWKGTSTISRIVIQDDMLIIGRTGDFFNDFGYRPDDFPTLAALSPASDFAIAAQGIIEQTTDVDSFFFHTPGGLLDIFAGVNPDSPTLDLSLSIVDADGNVVAERSDRDAVRVPEDRAR